VSASLSPSPPARIALSAVARSTRCSYGLFGAVRAVELAQRDVERGCDHSAARDVGGVDQFVEPVRAPTSAVTFEGGRTLVEIVGCSDRRELCVSSITVAARRGSPPGGFSC
jgi:hypothetical protein